MKSPLSTRILLFLACVFALTSCATDGTTTGNTGFGGGLTAAFGAPRTTSPAETLLRQMASSAGMKRHETAAGLFLLTAYERITDRAKPVNVYIEGDGKAGYNPHGTPVADPTPDNPLALRLAVQDPAPNVIWIARPCQYTKLVNADETCPAGYWMTQRLAPEIVVAFDEVLGDIRTRYGVATFNLIGVGSSAGIAAFVADRRKDVASLRTVAGNLDFDAYAKYHGFAPIEDSLNPRMVAPRLAKLPQNHFMGDRDNIVPPQVTESFVKALRNPTCTAARTVSASHDVGWVEIWPELLRSYFTCQDPTPVWTSPDGNLAEKPLWQEQEDAWEEKLDDIPAPKTPLFVPLASQQPPSVVPPQQEVARQPAPAPAPTPSVVTAPQVQEPQVQEPQAPYYAPRTSDPVSIIEQRRVGAEAATQQQAPQPPKAQPSAAPPANNNASWPLVAPPVWSDFK